MDRDDAMPDPIRAGLAEEGFFGLTVPRAWGGDEAPAEALAAVLAELSRESAAVATFLAVHLSVAAAPIAEWGSDEQRRRYLPAMARGATLGAFGLTEPGSGSDAGALATRYRREDGGYVLDGSKMFITNAGSAGITLVFATRDPALGHAGISAFLVPTETPGFSVRQRLDKLGIRGSETTELVFQSARLPRDALLGHEGSGLKIALAALTGGRVGIAACALGVADAAFEELQRLAKESPEDWKRSLVARAYADVRAARALIEQAARQKDRGEPYIEEASSAKLFASQTAVRVASAAMDIAGPAGAVAGARAGRLWRDARVFPIVEGTTEIQELILGRRLVGT
jgi:alkylation response protein AidB-like acyl-CoA dehydrogenase